MNLLKKENKKIEKVSFNYWINKAWHKKNKARLVFIHGLGEPPIVWEKVVSQFPEVPVCVIERPEYNNVLNVNSKAVLILVDKFLGNILKAEELSQTYLIGHSLGSYFALCSNLNIKGRILIAPFYHLYINNLSFINDDVNSQINKGFGVECSDLIKKEFTSLIRMVPESAKKQEYNIYDHLTLSGKKILKKNTLIIRPLGDLIVSKRQIKQLLSIVPSEKSIIYVPRTGHNIIYESPEVISSIISDYIN